MWHRDNPGVPHGQQLYLRWNETSLWVLILARNYTSGVTPILETMFALHRQFMIRRLPTIDWLIHAAIPIVSDPIQVPVFQAMCGVELPQKTMSV
jgi:hypothetical protein